MKKLLCLLLAAVMLVSLCACGAKQPDQKPAQEPSQGTGDWTRQGYFSDANENMVSVTWMDDIDEPGWYVGFMNGEDFIEDSYGGIVQQEGNTLRGVLASGGTKGELTVTISEDGGDGLLLAVEGGETYRFTPMEMEAPMATLRVNTDGLGFFTCVEKGQEPDGEEQVSSLQYGLAEPETYVLTAKAGEGWYFVKWTLNGEDYSSDEQITVEVTEDADFVAVFEFASDGQNPVMNFIGPYVSGRARALVECVGDDGAKITIEWGGSAWELARWVMSGRLDTDTLTVEYSDCVKSIVTYGDGGSLVSEDVEYENGSGRVVFGEDLTLTWQGDQSEQENLIFEWAWEPEPVKIDCGSSEIYTQEDLQAAVLAIEEAFASFEGCELHSIRYAGDEKCTEENLRWMNELAPEGKYTQVVGFLMDFHSPTEEGPYAWEIDTEYTDYQWWLARSEGGTWDVVTWGYG